jgi:hypothetical protein
MASSDCGMYFPGNACELHIYSLQNKQCDVSGMESGIPCFVTSFKQL